MVVGKKSLLIWGGFSLFFLGIALFAGQIAPYDPMATDMAQVELPPSASHLFGTDYLGRDLLSRVLVGGQTTVFASLLILVVAVSVGAGLGMLCGYWGGPVDRFFLSVTQVFLAFPGLVLAIAVASVLGGGLENAMISLAIIAWPKYARLVRAQTLVVRNAPFVDVALMTGTPTWKILVRHIFPNVAGPLLTTAVSDFGATMMELASLSFLGLGVTAPQAEWGAMMAVGVATLQTCPWVILAPGLALFFTILLANFLGDALRKGVL